MLYIPPAYALFGHCRAPVVVVSTMKPDTCVIANNLMKVHMTTAEKTQAPRTLNPAELAVLVKTFRELRQWSQEQLSEISGLSARTVQRVEDGQPAALDTRRALASAFGFEDIDALNKPYVFPTEEELKAEKAAFERDNVTLKALPVSGGRDLATLITSHAMDYSAATFELPREAAEQYAGLIDAYREYRDCAELYSEVDKLTVFDEFQDTLDALAQCGVTLRYSTRKITLKIAPDANPWTDTALYIFACEKGKEPAEVVTPRAVKLG